MTKSLRRLSVLACLVIVGWPVASIHSQDDPAPAGVLWQTTSQLKMAGQSFGPPPQSIKVCTRADAIEPPGSADDERGCVNSDFIREGLTVSWNSICAGPPEMTGTGQITYADDDFSSYSGALLYATEMGDVTIQLGGEQIGPCDNPR